MHFQPRQYKLQRTSSGLHLGEADASGAGLHRGEEDASGALIGDASFAAIVLEGIAFFFARIG